MIPKILFQTSKIKVRAVEITKLYIEILNREPDVEGLLNYVKGGLSFYEIKRQLLDSVEYKNLNKTNAKIFSDIYSNSLWSTVGYAKPYDSGEGSSKPHFVDAYVAAIENQILKLGQSLNALDLGCGNFLVGSKIRHLFNKYQAVDVVESVILNNKNVYSNLDVDFSILDAAVDDLPDADVVFVRQMLQHLSNDNIKLILPKLKKYKYLILTEHIPASTFIPNLDKETGPGVRYPSSGVVITDPPFNFTYIDKEVLVTLDGDWHGGILETTLYTLNDE